MSLYIVGYDLKSGQDYSPLIKDLQSFSNWWHCLDSTWIVESPKTVSQIRDQLWKHVHTNDKLFVAYYLPSAKGGQAAWNGFDENCGDWLNTNL